MPISKEQLIGFCREGHLYHLAQGRSWLKIREHGLRSTSSILDLFEITGPERFAIESQRRPASRKICHPVHREVTIRDQGPLNEAMLRRCLEGCTPKEFYELLNGRVFFWLSLARVAGMMNAYRGSEHDLLTLDAHRFIDAYAGKIELSPLNSGAVRSVDHRRGQDLFKSLNQYPFDPRARNRWSSVAELTVRGAVEDVCSFVERVDRADGETSKLIYQR